MADTKKEGRSTGMIFLCAALLLGGYGINSLHTAGIKPSEIVYVPPAHTMKGKIVPGAQQLHPPPYTTVNYTVVEGAVDLRAKRQGKKGGFNWENVAGDGDRIETKEKVDPREVWFINHDEHTTAVVHVWYKKIKKR